MQMKAPDKATAARAKTLAKLIQANGASKAVLHTSGTPLNTVLIQASSHCCKGQQQAHGQPQSPGTGIVLLLHSRSM